jgi:predicted RNase H-like HicB family nuclease
MSPRFTLSNYIDQALAQAIYDKLEDRSFSGKIPACAGVVAFAANLRECKEELRAVLENWILLELRKGQALPIISGIDLNNIPAPEAKDAPRAKKKNRVSGKEIQHRLVDAQVTQRQIVEYLHTKGWKNLHGSKVSRVINGKIRMPEKLELAILAAIEKLRERP